MTQTIDMVFTIPYLQRYVLQTSSYRKVRQSNFVIPYYFVNQFGTNHAQMAGCIFVHSNKSEVQGLQETPLTMH